MFGALAHGLPSVALPQGADNFNIANLLEKAGVAHTLMPAEVTGAAIRSGLRTLLDVVTYGQRTCELAGEIAAMPSPGDVAARLGRLADPLPTALSVYGMGVPWWCRTCHPFVDWRHRELRRARGPSTCVT